MTKLDAESPKQEIILQPLCHVELLLAERKISSGQEIYMGLQGFSKNRSAFRPPRGEQREHHLDRPALKQASHLGC